MIMKYEFYPIRSGYDGKKCIVHARCCDSPFGMIATAQYLDVKGSDLFSGILMSKSTDGGKSWSEFVPQPGLAPIAEGRHTTVGCDGTPMYHKKTGKVLLLGHTAQYLPGSLIPNIETRHTFYSVYSPEEGQFKKMRFLQMPEGYENCGDGCGQSIELDNGELLIPVYYNTKNENNAYTMVLRCAFDGETLTLLEMGNAMTIAVARGLGEPSIIFHDGIYHMTLRNDYMALVAKSEDGLHYTDLKPWRWEDGSLLDSYNTQQHWMRLGEELYLVYTRRGANNDHVFRHRAPLFAARVENMKLVRDSEFIVVPERGARLGNFGVTQLSDTKAMVMAAEWMQPKGCEAYGSDNTIWVCVVECE